MWLNFSIFGRERFGGPSCIRMRMTDFSREMARFSDGERLHGTSRHYKKYLPVLTIVLQDIAAMFTTSL